MRIYIYLGDRNTDPVLKNQECFAVLRNGKCVRGRNGSMLVEFRVGHRHVVTARRLRRVDKENLNNNSSGASQKDTGQLVQRGYFLLP